MTPETLIRAEAISLTKTFTAHRRDQCAFANSIFAVYGVASPLGRLVDKFSTLNSYVLTVLRHDFPWVGREAGLWTYDPPNERGATPTPAAQAMMDPGLSRDRGRKVPTTIATDRALIAYAAERLALLIRAQALFEDAVAISRRYSDLDRDALQRWIGKAKKERHTFERILALLPA
jgi:hypothetical protein